VVPRRRHDELLEALAGTFSQVQVGDPFDAQTQMGPLVASRQRDRVEGYIAKGIADGFTLATGGGRPKDLDGWFVEPTVFGNVDNQSVIAQEEIFGPVLSVIPAEDEQDAIAIANDTIYGLNASVFTNDVNRARRSPASCAPAPSGTTRSGPTSASRSAGSSSPASAAKADGRDCCPSSRPRP
jgi:acyl-CoA reductase-like NAD-dependent aldehyde dehydrogenase